MGFIVYQPLVCDKPHRRPFTYDTENGSVATVGVSWIAGYLSWRSHLCLPMACKWLTDQEVPVSKVKGHKGTISDSIRFHLIVA